MAPLNTYTDGATDYRSHTFLDDGVFTVVSGTISADYFIVAGGGGGGGNAGDGGGAWGAGGAGGAGGFLTDTSVSLIAQAYTSNCWRWWRWCWLSRTKQ